MHIPSRSSWMRRLVPLALALIVACTLLEACGSGDNEKEQTPVSTGVPAVSGTAVPTPSPLSGPPRIGAAVWATAIDPQSGAPLAAATPTAEDRTIYAVFPIESLPAGSQLIAHWFFNDTSLDGLDSAMRIDVDRTSGWLEFHIEQTGNDPWPDGDYEVVVTDGTNELQRSMVTVS